MKVSIVILTFNRPQPLTRLLSQLTPLVGAELEIVVVDNGSQDGTADLVARSFPSVNLLALDRNHGVGARNRGIEAATGDIILNLDDDMCDLDPAGLDHIRERFQHTPRLGGLCLKVTWPGTNRVRDWVHRRPSSFADSVFPTYEITEGAVAWRRQALTEAGLYREDFFISHEGVELAYRLLNRGWDIEYDGRVSVGHDHAQGGRTSWRRYYFDTRNQFWVAALHHPPGYALRYLTVGTGAMLLYALRDRHLLAWLRGMWDGLRGLPTFLAERSPWTSRTREIIGEADSWRPPFWKLALKRLGEKDFSME